MLEIKKYEHAPELFIIRELRSSEASLALQNVNYLS